MARDAVVLAVLLGLLLLGTPAEGAGGSDPLRLPPLTVPLAAEGALVAFSPSGPVERIVVAATSAANPEGAGVIARHTGAGRVPALSATGNEVSLVAAGQSLAGFSFDSQLWAEQGIFFHQIVAVETDAVHLAWIYCVGPAVLGVWHESTRDADALVWTSGTGPCAILPGATPAQVTLPAIDMPYPRAVGGFSIDGPAIFYDGSGPGRIEFEGRELVLLPFETVDCSACGGLGWFEVHALVYDPLQARLFTGILYFEQAGTVALHYVLELPTLRQPSARAYTAEWTIG